MAGRSVEPVENQASPLAGDLLNLLRGQLTGLSPQDFERMGQLQRMQDFAGRGGMMGKAVGGLFEKMGGADELARIQGRRDESAFGTGIGPLQREAGTAIRQFVESGGLPPALMNQMNRATDAQALDLREAFGAAGSRFGTPLAMGEGLMRADALSQLGAEGIRNLMQGIELMQTMGDRNIAPFLEMIGLGVPQATMVEKPGTLDHIKSGVDIIGGLASAGKDIKSL